MAMDIVCSAQEKTDDFIYKYDRVWIVSLEVTENISRTGPFDTVS